MKSSRLLALGMFLSAAISSHGAFAAVDAGAAVVKLRTNCTEGGVTLNNCFITMSDVVNWITTTRIPKASANSPLLVEIGPGTFNRLVLTCNATQGFTGYISFVGAGVSQTTIQHDDFNLPVVQIDSCTHLSFADLRISGLGYNYIVWNGGGISSWRNVEVDTPARAWVEEQCGATKGSHYWFASRILTREVFTIGDGYNASCDESWFFGSEITVSRTGTGFFNLRPLVASGNGEIHVYGGVIRALASYQPNSNVGTLRAAVATSGGKIHIHGTGIDQISTFANNIVALSASSGGMIHANASAYNLTTGGSATIKRINKDTDPLTHVHAPYLWEEHPNPPNIASVTGADMAMVTSGTSDGHPHLVVYDSTCASKWYDTVDKACRP